jgi:diguanylate cyclase (GGDEF)-like protein/PAS domain S-box-containing protein
VTTVSSEATGSGRVVAPGFAGLEAAAALAAHVPVSGAILRAGFPGEFTAGVARCPVCDGTGVPGPPFHATFPVRDVDGAVVGSLCTFGPTEQVLTEAESGVLNALATQAGVLVGLSRELAGARIELAEISAEQQRSREAEAGCRQLVECLPDVFYRVTTDGVISAMSASGRELLGKDLSGAHGSTALEVIHEDDRAAFSAAFVRARTEDSGSESIVARLRGDDGEYAHFDVLFAPRVHPETGDVVEVFIVCRDISDRVREAAALAQRTDELARSEERFRQVVLYSGVGTVLTDFEGNWVEFNDALASMLGYTRDEFDAMSFVDLIPPGDFPLHRDTLESLLSGEGSLIRADFRYVHKDRSVLWFSTTSTLIRSADGTPLHIASHVEDVTHRRAALEAVSAQRDKSAALLSTVRDAYAYAVNGRIEDVNEAMCELTALRRDQLIGQTAPFSFWPAEYRGEDAARARKAMVDRRGEIEMQYLRPDGSRVDVSIYTCPVEDATTGLPGLVAIARDVTEARRRERQLQHLAEHDGLTGLLNQTSFTATLQQHLATAQQDLAVLTLVLIDLDNFKVVNDTYGHVVGDAVLVEFAARLRRAARGGDVLGRVGGEEFAWLMPASTWSDALGAVERTATRMRAELFPEVGKVTFSAGVSEWDPRDERASDWLAVAQDLRQRADTGLYAAKRNGRDCVATAPREGRRAS